MKRTGTELSTQSLSSVRSAKQAKYKSKAARKSLVTYGRSPAVPRWGFPRQLYMAHKFSETIQTSSTSGALQQVKIRANGLYRPYVGGSTSVGYFTTCSSVYDHFTVVKSKIKFTIVSNTTGFAAAQTFSLYIDDDTTGVADMNSGSVQPGSVFKMVAPSHTDPVILTSEWSARKFFGGDPLANDDLQGTATTDPVEQSIFMLNLQSIGGVSQTYYVNFEVWYYAIWDELKTVAQG